MLVRECRNTRSIEPHPLYHIFGMCDPIDDMAEGRACPTNNARCKCPLAAAPPSRARTCRAGVCPIAARPNTGPATPHAKSKHLTPLVNATTPGRLCVRAGQCWERLQATLNTDLAVYDGTMKRATRMGRRRRLGDALGAWSTLEPP